MTRPRTQYDEADGGTALAEPGMGDEGWLYEP
jgi:hypothetical protein